jgi:hypothetical protein
MAQPETPPTHPCISDHIELADISPNDTVFFIVNLPGDYTYTGVSVDNNQVVILRKIVDGQYVS